MIFVTLNLGKGDTRIVNTDKILYCHEYKGKMCVELEDGTPLYTDYTRAELEAIFHSSGVAFTAS